VKKGGGACRRKNSEVEQYYASAAGRVDSLEAGMGGIVGMSGWVKPQRWVGGVSCWLWARGK